MPHLRNWVLLAKKSDAELNRLGFSQRRYDITMAWRVKRTDGDATSTSMRDNFVSYAQSHSRGANRLFNGLAPHKPSRSRCPRECHTVGGGPP